MGTMLIPPASASESLPGQMTTAGDRGDDDAAIMDTMIESHAEPPKPADKPTQDKPPAETTAKAQPLTRVLAATLTLPAATTWDAVLLMPADPNRVNLTLYALSEYTSNYLRWSDDPGKVQSVGTSARLYSGQQLTFAGGTHTGPVWVYAPDIANSPITVEAIAVTR